MFECMYERNVTRRGVKNLEKIIRNNTNGPFALKKQLEKEEKVAFVRTNDRTKSFIYENYTIPRA
jgi:hypothetical protein